MVQDEPQELKSFASTILELPPSCLEFCSSFPEFFVAGTYYLESHSNDGESDCPSQERRGSLLLFRLQGQNLTLLHTTYTPSAVLDLHFAPHDPTTLAVATSIGDIRFYRLNASASNPSVDRISQSHIFAQDVLVLSLAWEPVSSRDDFSRIAVSLSNGNVAIIAYAADFQSHQILWQSAVHSLEAWMVIYSPEQEHDYPCFLYSGGDDSALCIRKLVRQDGSLGYENLARDTKSHGAGVTAILPLSATGGAGERNLLTGSYDEYLRVYDTASRPNVLAEEKLGGGVWRLKLMLASEPSARAAGHGPMSTELSFTILASCMHAGVRLVRVTRIAGGKWSIKVLAAFEEHESMNYASDVQPRSKTSAGDENDVFTCVSTSFYDRKLCVWKYRERGGEEQV